MSCITEIIIKWQDKVKIFRIKLAVYECSVLRISNEALTTLSENNDLHLTWGVVLKGILEVAKSSQKIV